MHIAGALAARHRYNAYLLQFIGLNWVATWINLTGPERLSSRPYYHGGWADAGAAAATGWFALYQLLAWLLTFTLALGTLPSIDPCPFNSCIKRPSS